MPPRPQGGRLVRTLPVAIAAGTTINGIRLRRRAARLAVLEPDDTDPGPVYTFLTADGVEVDDATRRAAAAHAHREGLEALDLVPGDLPAERALDTLRMVDPARYRSNRLAPGRGAYQATLVTLELASRARLDELAADLTRLRPAEYVAVIEQIKRYACTTTDLAVAPWLRASPDRPDQRLEHLEAIYHAAAPAAVAVPLLQYAGLAAGLAARPVLGAGALAAFSAQSAVALSGANPGLAPRHLPVAAAARAVREPARWVRAVGGRRRPADTAGPDRWEQRRPLYDDELAEGTQRFFEPRRDDCPWCGSKHLSVRVTTHDLLQHKPGTFTLEQCGVCDHVFQNPRLSLEGLDFYYRDFYDGLGEADLEFVFGASARPYQGRAEMVRAAAPTPKAWLDVGAGHGHFCNVARDTFPHTAFDGLDLSESIEEAERRGWIDRGYRGLFPELADELVGSYDVVSMHHYLEHTREPLDELDAAARVLLKGGHLLIELPDPESSWAKVLGRKWVPWFQPQHQHLMPIDNLQEALTERGFTIVSVDRGRADQPVDLVFALWLTLNDWAPPSKLPWRPRQPRSAAARRAAVLTAGAPALLGALLADNLLGLARRNRVAGNTYRVLARRD